MPLYDLLSVTLTYSKGEVSVLSVRSLNFKSKRHHPHCVCVCLENADNVATLKGRVKAARDKTKDLLKAVNGTMATLNAIPNGMTAQIHRER